MKLNYKRTFLVGLAFMSISAFWQLYDSIIPLMLKNTFGLGDTLAGGIMALDNILALFLLPLFGTLSDRVDTPIGKRMPFVLVGTGVTVLAMVCLPIADNLTNLPLFMSVLFVTLLAVSVYRSPAVALMPDVTPPALRSKANAVINLMGALGAVLALVLIRVLVPEGDRPDYMPIFGLVAGVMVVATLVLFATIKEKKLASEMQAMQASGEGTHQTDSANQGTGVKGLAPAVRRSLICLLLSVFFWFMAYNAVTTAFSKYAQEVLGMEGGKFASSLLVATIVAVVAFIPVGIFASNLGRKRTILFGVALMFVGFTAAFFFTSYHPAVNILLGLVGLGWAAINVNSYPMVVEMAKGSDIGKFTGYYYTFSMSGQIITPVLSGAFLEYVGYRTLFPYAAIFMLLACLTMTQVKHGDHKPLLPKDKLEMLDVGD
ncbi:MAG TPA: SLC45 family MFS transporter [Firmicutes bacterium]|nr:SLC45 family MFS transporter [Bacillota bacterium]